MDEDHRVLGPVEFAEWCSGIATKEANEMIEIKFRAVCRYAWFMASVISGFVVVELITGAATGRWFSLQLGGVLTLAYAGILGPVLWILHGTEAEVIIEPLPRKVTMRPDRSAHSSTDLH